MDAWIDTYHAVRRLTRDGTFVFLTDNAVGAQEEDNLRHLVTNLGRDVPRERIVPFLTSKHTLEYCLSYAERAQQHGFPALVVLGGDKARGHRRGASSMPGSCARCCADATRRSRSEGGPIRTPMPERQVDFLTDGNSDRRVLSDADRQPPRRRACRALHRRGAPARADPAGAVRSVLLPQRESADAGGAEGLSAGAGRGAHAESSRRGDTAEDVCARTIRTLARCRRPALLHQQPADWPSAGGPDRHSRQGRRHSKTEELRN